MSAGTIIKIPTRTDLPHYTFSMDLDNSTFGFNFDWNDRDSSWYMSISDVSGNPLLSSLRVVLGAPFTSRYKNIAGLPLGRFILVDTSGTDTEAALGDLGVRVVLLYVTAT